MLATEGPLDNAGSTFMTNALTTRDEIKARMYVAIVPASARRVPTTIRIGLEGGAGESARERGKH
jgi:hypothetical protein